MLLLRLIHPCPAERKPLHVILWYEFPETTDGVIRET